MHLGRTACTETHYCEGDAAERGKGICDETDGAAGDSGASRRNTEQQFNPMVNRGGGGRIMKVRPT